MKRVPSNLSEEDMRIYRRWTRGIYLSYLTAIIIAVAVIFLRGPSGELTASTDTQITRQQGPSASIDMSTATIAAAKP